MHNMPMLRYKNVMIWLMQMHDILALFIQPRFNSTPLEVTISMKAFVKVVLALLVFVTGGKSQQTEG